MSALSCATRDIFRQCIDSKREDYVALLEQLTNMESGSEMTAGVEQVAGLVADRLGALGLQVTRHRANGYAAHLTANTKNDAPPIVLGGHLDTTFTSYANLPKFHIDGDKAIGPGTCDMRGGVLVFLMALECLSRAGLLDALPIVVMLNTDEERGAPTSHHLFQERAGHCKAALFGECGGAHGELVVSRRAKLSYTVEAHGVGRHAGELDGTKSSALVALSHAIIGIEQLNDRFDGGSFNVGRAFGGIASNTVPEHGVALVDIRYPDPAQEADIRSAMQAVCDADTVPGARVTLEQTSARPAWCEHTASQALFDVARGVGKDLGILLEPDRRGGTADSNWFGSVQVPCLDGLGPVGFFDHTPNEYIVLESLFERSLLVAGLIMAIDEREITK